MEQTCKCGCGAPVPPKEGPGRKPLYIPEHAPDPRKRDRRKLLSPVSPIRPGAQLTSVDGDAEPALVAATRAELAAVQREQTPEGLLALTIAAQIAAGGGTQAGLAALVKAFREAKADALKGAAKVRDVIDDIFDTG